MPFVQIFPLPGSKIRRIILHDNNSNSDKRYCVTLDFQWEADLVEVYRKVFERTKEYGNWDEPQGKAYHDSLHTDMMAAMGVNMASTLTDFHQHWVRKYTQSDASGNQTSSYDLFTSGEAMLLIQKLSKAKYLTMANLETLALACQ